MKTDICTKPLLTFALSVVLFAGCLNEATNAYNKQFLTANDSKAKVVAVYPFRSSVTCIVEGVVDQERRTVNIECSESNLFPVVDDVVHLESGNYIQPLKIVSVIRN